MPFTLAAQEGFQDPLLDRFTGQWVLRGTIAFIGWDEASGRYACLWLDSTGGEGLTNGVLGYAEPDDDTLAFVFVGTGFGAFHTTFTYEEEGGAWRWTMDAVNGEERRAFARLRMTRR